MYIDDFLKDGSISLMPATEKCSIGFEIIISNDMEEKYKVLWLDDAFASESSDKLNERLEKFQQTPLASSFEIKKVAYAEDFMQEFAKNLYYVVILDVFGYSKTDVNNKI